MGVKTVVVAIVCAGFAVGAVAYAAIPSSTGVISGCYVRDSGALRVIDAEAGASCKSRERPLSWNQAGPQGPAGPAGPAGPEGPPGEGSELVTHEVNAFTSDVTSSSGGFDVKSVSAGCDTDEALTGGGYRLGGSPAVLAQVNVTTSASSGSTVPPSAWLVVATAPTGVGSWYVEANALCSGEGEPPGPLP